MLHLVDTIESTRVDIPGGWVTIIVAFITAVIAPCAFAILTARLNGKVNRMSEDTSATRDQVVNSHQTNLREEGDERHGQLMREIRSVKATLDEHGKDIGGIKESIRLLTRADQQAADRAMEQGERIRDLEKTQPRTRKKES